MEVLSSDLSPPETEKRPGITPVSSRAEKLAYCQAKFAGWQACCYRLPWVSAGFQNRPLFGYIVVQDPSGLTLIGDVDMQRPKWGDGDLGVRFNRGDEIVFGVGPNPYDTYAFMWWAREHWAHCEHHFVSLDMRMSMLLASSKRYHAGDLKADLILASDESAEDDLFSPATKFVMDRKY